jgi:hypothetical protein
VLAGDGWLAWRVLLAAAMGEALTDEERVTFGRRSCRTKLVARTLDAARTSTRERYLPPLPAAEVEVKPLAPAWVP